MGVALIANSSMIPRRRTNGGGGYHFDPSVEMDSHASTPYSCRGGSTMTMIIQSKTIAIGGGTAPDLMMGVEWAKDFFGEEPCTNSILLSWCRTDLSRKTNKKRYYDIEEKPPAAFVEMSRSTKAAADDVILLGPGTATTWQLPPSWDAAALLSCDA